MAKKEIAVLLLAATLAGCLSRGSGSSDAPIIHSDGVWLRTDGQSGRDNPALAAQFQSDQAACTVAGGIQRACMTKRGYILVPREQAEATAARLRAENPSVNQNPVVQ
jgi:hypothetical protein